MSKKVLNVVNQEDLKIKVSDVEVFGDGNLFELVSKASSASQGWMKSTKAMPVYGAGLVLQVSTQQGDNVAEALQFIPNAHIVKDIEGNSKIVSTIFNGAMKLDNMAHLESIIEQISEKFDNFKVAIYFKLPNLPKHEAIINHKDNLPEKLSYYRKAYNEDLTLKANPDVKMEYIEVL